MIKEEDNDAIVIISSYGNRRPKKALCVGGIY